MSRELFNRTRFIKKFKMLHQDTLYGHINAKIDGHILEPQSLDVRVEPCSAVLL